MVNLKEISTSDLFSELVSRDDGRAYIDLEKANLNFQECFVKAQEKAGQKILDFMKDYFKEQQEFYKNRYGADFWEAMKQDNVEYSLLEDKRLAPLVFNYMSHFVG